MPRYFAIFGKTPALSAAEIWSALRADGLTAKTIRISADGMIFETGPELDPGFFDRLGGTVKAGRIVEGLDRSGADVVADRIAEDLERAFPEGRIEFGLSSYTFGGAPEGSPRSDRIGAAVKSALTGHGRKARHVTSKDKTLSAVTIRTNRLLDRGREYCLFADNEGFSVGVTAWVQDYEAFSEREFGRPKSDAVSGMVPVKLARMLLNLAGAHEGASVLDPFCGSGTIAVEAVAMGCGKAIASDSSEKAVKEAAENLEWIKDLSGNVVETMTLVSPVQGLPALLPGEKVDAVVTEPYLGPPLRGRERPEEIAKTKRGLETLYLEAFRAFAALAGEKASVVFIFPMLPGDSEGMAEALLPEISETGFAPDPPVPERFAHTPGFELTGAGGIVYSRPGQKVRREIMRFRRA